MDTIIKQALFTLTVFLLWTSGCIHGSDVTQNSTLWRFKGQDATIDCSHTKGDLYFYMYWFRQLPGEMMKLIVFTSTTTTDHDFGEFSKEKFSATKTVAKSGTFTVKNLEPKDTGLYFCAVSRQISGGGAEAYFGGGTKLTVLDPEIKITPPEVEILKPSDKECKNKKTKKKKKTLVCVAKNFYPDHVSVFWQVDGEDQTNGVATDEAAQRIGSYYRITSRLRVSAKEWFTPGKNFTCVVHFFNGTVTETRENFTVNENAHESGRISREKYLSITRNAILTYGVLVAKSCAYGAFVGVLVWKLQSSAKKHH